MWQEGNLPRRMWLAAQRTAAHPPRGPATLPHLCAATQLGRRGAGLDVPPHCTAQCRCLNCFPVSVFSFSLCPCWCHCSHPLPASLPPCPCFSDNLDGEDEEDDDGEVIGAAAAFFLCSSRLLPLQQQAFASAAAAFSLCSSRLLPLQQRRFPLWQQRPFVSRPRPASAICSPHFRLTKTFIVGAATCQLRCTGSSSCSLTHSLLPSTQTLQTETFIVGGKRVSLHTSVLDEKATGEQRGGLWRGI